MVLVLRVTTIIHDNDNGYVWVVGYDNDGGRYLFNFFIGEMEGYGLLDMTMIPLQWQW